MRPETVLLLERLGYLAVVAYLQWNVVREGYYFARQVRSFYFLPGTRDEGSRLGRNDLSDHQWRSFRDSAWLLAAALASFVVISRLTRAAGRHTRQSVVVLLSLAFMGALHGTCAVHVVGLSVGGYLLARRLAGVPYGLLGVWAYACGTLLLARLTEGLPFARISASLAPLDAHRGLLRWHIHYNLLVLRMVSYAADLHWATVAKRTGQQQQLHDPQQQHQQQDALGEHGQPRSQDQGSKAGGAAGGRVAVAVGAGGAAARGTGEAEGGGRAREGRRGLAGLAWLEREERARVSTPLPLPYYHGLLPYLEYCLYPPLYIAGPIMSYNSFASQRAAPLGLTWRQLLVYALRALLAWGCLEAVTHALPYNAIAKHRVLDWLAAQQAAGGPGAKGLPVPRPLHYAITGYWVLVFMWLKFTTIWRFFRVFALADGLVPPENMTRCVCNNYTVEGFWRSWHASYNRWLVRYMYVPLGGAAWRAANVWLIFSFVALWHDLEWRLLGWAWIMAAAMAPELLAQALCRTAAARRLRGGALFRHVCAAAAAANILLLMAGNLVGFVVGVDGIAPLAQQVLGQPRFLAVVLLALFSAAQLMFWKREVEARGEGEGRGSGAKREGERRG